MENLRYIFKNVQLMLERDNMEDIKNSHQGFYISVPSIIIQDDRLTARDIIVYGVIDGLSKNEHEYCYMRYKYIAESAGVTKRQLYYNLDRLIKFKYIEKFIVKNRVCLKPYRDLSEEMKKKFRKKMPVIEEDYNWLEEE